MVNALHAIIKYIYMKINSVIGEIISQLIKLCKSSYFGVCRLKLYIMQRDLAEFEGGKAFGRNSSITS
jgi:hypothetical protein